MTITLLTIAWLLRLHLQDHLRNWHSPYLLLDLHFPHLQFISYPFQKHLLKLLTIHYWPHPHLLSNFIRHLHRLLFCLIIQLLICFWSVVLHLVLVVDSVLCLRILLLLFFTRICLFSSRWSVTFFIVLSYHTVFIDHV